MLKGIRIEAKPFALGVRIEHPQTVIDRIRYHCEVRVSYLPPASYTAVQQVDGRGVYSFCMCPGGTIAPCATAPGEVVTNGWSPSKRNNPFANSGIVVETRFDMDDPLAGVAFQREVEQAAWRAGGQRQCAPAQRMEEGRASADLPACSYQPGIIAVPLDEVLPSDIAGRLRGGLKAFGEKMRGYRTNEAVLVAVESRTSSPVRIPRDPITLRHPEVHGLYPCGEGAGYAGGIVSAARTGYAWRSRRAGSADRKIGRGPLGPLCTFHFHLPPGPRELHAQRRRRRRHVEGFRRAEARNPDTAARPVLHLVP